MAKDLLASTSRTTMMVVPKEVEEVLLRIEQGTGVIGTITCNEENTVIRHTIENALAEKAVPFLREVCDIAEVVVRDIDPSNELSFVRINTRRYEMMVAPDDEFMVAVLQNPTY